MPRALPDRLDRIDAHLRNYVDRGELAGWHVAITRDDELVHSSTYGLRSIEHGSPVEQDTIWRIYSMTKPLTAVAVLMLWEGGAFDLTDPIEVYLPAFAGTRVLTGGTADDPELSPSDPIRIWHLLTHTSGLTFAMANASPVDALYRRAGLDWAGLQSMPLAASCARIAQMPLLFEPGSEWNYSVSSDVLGRLVEIVSGQSLADFMSARIFGPLGMRDTGFSVPPSQADRVASLYYRDPATGTLMLQAAGERILSEATGHYGGAGLASTMADYVRFARMLCRRGALDGARLLSSATLDFAAANHLPDGALMDAFARPIWSQPHPAGTGFNLLGSVVTDPVAAKTLGTIGNYGWSGAAGSYFWVDPAEQLTCVFMAQVTSPAPSPLRQRLKQLVYQAMERP